MVPLVLEKKNEEKAKQIVEYAKSHRIAYAEMLRLSKGEGPFPGEDENLRMVLPVAFVACYTVEEHPQTEGGFRWLRHFSLGITVEGRAPNTVAVEMVAKMFDMPTLAECMVSTNPEPFFSVDLYAEFEET